MSDVSDAEVEAFYLRHRARFARPEMRTLRHILVTINEDLPGSEREAARANIEAARARLAQEPGRFAELALRRSECPTALNGGLIGRVPRGLLFPEVEAAGFTLAPGEISGVVESPMGFHLVFCEAVHPEGLAPLVEVREKLRARLTELRRRDKGAAPS